MLSIQFPNTGKGEITDDLKEIGHNLRFQMSPVFLLLSWPAFKLEIRYPNLSL